MKRKIDFFHKRSLFWVNRVWVLFLVFFIMVPVCRPQGNPFAETPGVKILRGIVTTTDWVNSTFVVRWLAQTVYDEMTFKATSDTKVFVQNFPAQLSDIQESDDVTVEYIDNGFAGLKVISITDTSPLDGD